MTFRCSENDIFVDEKLLKPYGRLWVGNPVVGLRCGTIMVARVRSNFCQSTMLWKDWNRRESEGKALPGKVAEGLEATSVSSWAPMWDHYGRKG